jgi:hypothetical protein
LRVPGFRLKRAHGRDLQYECRDKSCDWVGTSERWSSFARRDPVLLLRLCWAHADEHHGELSRRKVSAHRSRACEQFGLNPSGHTRAGYRGYMPAEALTS